jgi:hypothetical protein
MRARLLPLVFSMGCLPPVGTPLVNGAAWLPSEADPVPDHRPEGATCAATGWQEELGGIEIDTGPCPYAVFEQPLLVDLPAGAPIDVLAWHSDLVFEPPAEGHFAIYVAGEPLYDVTVPIPSDADVFSTVVDAPIRLEAGAPVVLHLHNHGTNTWNVNRLEVGE